MGISAIHLNSSIILITNFKPFTISNWIFHIFPWKMVFLLSIIVLNLIAIQKQNMVRVKVETKRQNSDFTFTSFHKQ